MPIRQTMESNCFFQRLSTGVIQIEWLNRKCGMTTHSSGAEIVWLLLRIWLPFADVPFLLNSGVMLLLFWNLPQNKMFFKRSALHLKRIVIIISFCIFAFPTDIQAQWRKSSELFPVNRVDKGGFIDITGEIIIPLKFDRTGNFSDGLGGVVINGKCGFVDKTGRIVIAPRFDNCGSFSEGLAPAMIKQDRERWGYINKSGKWIIKPQFDTTHPFSEGRALVGGYVGNGEDDDNWKYGFIDRSGKKVIPLKFFSAGDFSEGLANVRLGGKWGYIDKMGRIVIRPKFQYADNFSEGLATVMTGSLDNESRGYIDKTGRVIIPLKFDDARRFSEGLAPVKVGKEWGYIDRVGNMVIELQFDLAWSFSEGLARVINCKKECAFEYIDRNRQVIVEFPFRTTGADDFHGGLAAVVTDANSLCYIDRAGKFVWKTK